MIDGGLLPGVQGFAFCHIAIDIEQNDFFDNVPVCQYVGYSSSYVTSANNGYFAHFLFFYDFLQKPFWSEKSHSNSQKDQVNKPFEDSPQL
jgi:hypothetical protein